jgi:hypothetical protein
MEMSYETPYSVQLKNNKYKKDHLGAIREEAKARP